MAARTVEMIIKARDEASRTLGTIDRVFGGLGRTFRSVAAMALTAAGVGGLTYMLKKTMDNIDATAKLSDRLGVATEDLTAFQHGANISGVSLETSAKAAEIFMRRIGEVRMGTGEAKQAFDILKLSADALAGRGLIDNLKVVADRINALPTAADKAAVANQLFGRSGASILNYLQEGSQGIEQFRKEADKLGITFSRLDAYKVEAANDAITRLRGVFTGAFQTAVIQLAPTIEGMANKFIEMATEGEGMGAKVGSALEKISGGMFGIGDGIDETLIKFTKLELRTKEWLLDWEELKANTRETWSLFRSMGEEGSNVNYKANPFYQAQVEIEQLREKLYQQEVALVTKNRNAFSLTGNTDGGSAGALIDKELTALEKRAAIIFEQTRTPQEKFNAQIDELNMLLEKGLIDVDLYNRAWEKFAEGLNKPTDAIKELVQEAQKIFEETRTPFEKFSEQLKLLDILYTELFIDEETYRRAVEKTKKDLLGGASERRLSTQEIYQPLSWLNFGGMQRTTETGDIKKNTGETVKQLRDMGKSLRDVVAQLKEQNRSNPSGQTLHVSDFN